MSSRKPGRPNNPTVKALARLTPREKFGTKLTKKRKRPPRISRRPILNNIARGFQKTCPTINNNKIINSTPKTVLAICSPP
jgi:hypothetical protein